MTKSRGPHLATGRRKAPVTRSMRVGGDVMGPHSVPILSVLICTRNRADKLKRAVDSVLANSFTDYELIVVDQSTDGRTAAALATIDDDRLRYIHTDTVGVAKSRNIAVCESRAEIVVYTDDDCVCHGE